MNTHLNATQLSLVLGIQILVAFMLCAAVKMWLDAPFSVPEPIILTADCTASNIPESWLKNERVKYAAYRLERHCQAEKEALLMMQIWQTDPAAGEVLGE